jgi:hypothetical protein
VHFTKKDAIAEMPFDDSGNPSQRAGSAEAEQGRGLELGLGLEEKFIRFFRAYLIK